MVQHVAELNRVLLTAKALSPKNSPIGVNSLIKHCKDIAIESRMPDHAITIDFSIEMGLMEIVAKQSVLISEAGYAFLDFNPEELYDLSEKQKLYLLRSFFLDGKFRKNVKECFRCFIASEKKETFFWSSVDGSPFGQNSWIVNHLEQLGVIEEIEDGFIVRNEYLSTITTFINEPKGYTEEQLLEWLAEKKKLGNTAEHLVLNYERERLKALGFQVEARCVKPVGKLRTDAGYDIESFDGNSPNMHFDRFIEVKGSGDAKLRFVWTPNEMKVAQKLKERYWIYYQGGIDKISGKSKYNPILIQDPFHSIPKNTNLARTENGVVVTGPIRGELIKI
jgi:hypothetical protein